MSTFMWLISTWAILSIFATAAVLAAAVMASRSEPVPRPVAADQTKNCTKNRPSPTRERDNARRTDRTYPRGPMPLEQAV